MAEIVLGIGTSHGPMLSTPPERWGQRVEADRKRERHDYRGKTHTFDELVASYHEAARALLDGRSFVTPHDVKRVAPDVLRHRVVVSYEAEADGILPDAVVEAVLAAVEIP